MSWIPDRYRELRTMLRPERVAEDVDEELAHHLEMRIEHLQLRGMSEEDARQEALRRFGDVGKYRAQTCEIEESVRKEQRRMEVMDAIRRETRYSVRSLLRAPLFTLVSILTLGLGVGATTAIFTLLDSIVLRPLPYPSPERLVSIRHAVPKVGEDQKWGNSVSSYFYYLDNNRSFEAMGAFTGGSVLMSGEGDTEQVEGSSVTPSLFSVLGIRPLQGRLFTEADTELDAPPVAVISYETWQSRFGGAASVVGSSVRLNSVPTEIIGILEPGAKLPETAAGVLAPLQISRAHPPVNSHWVQTYARLRPGVTPEAATADLRAMMARFPEVFPQAYSVSFFEGSGFTPDVTFVRSNVLGGIESILWILLGAVALVLLIACANVANLFLVRAEARRREQTVRAALGAERAHFAVHYLTESLLLAVASSIVGIFFAWAGVRMLVRIAPVGLPRIDEIGLSPTAILFAIAVAATMGLIFGLAPVVRARVNFSELREGGRGMTASRERQLMRSALVVGQVGLALVLLAAGGLMLRSFLKLQQVRAGIDGENVLTFEVLVPEATRAERAAVVQFQRELMERVRALPGVTTVGGTSRVPLAAGSGCAYTTIEGRVYGSENPPCMPTVVVMPGYFESLGISVTGRSHEWSDIDNNTGVAVVSRAFAERMWPGEDPMGRGVMSFQDGAPWYRVVGVADDVLSDGLDKPAIEAIYFSPVPIEGTWMPISRSMTFTVKTATSDPLALAPAIRGIVREMSGDVAMGEARTMRDIMMSSDRMARTAFMMLLLGIAAAIALFLSAVGLYGVVAYLVSRRRAEIGVRMALGARVSEVARLVVMQSVRITAIGIVIGIAAALIVTRLLSTLLWQVDPTDPVTLVLVSALLLTVAMVASAVPARRAARTAPSEALRGD